MKYVSELTESFFLHPPFLYPLFSLCSDIDDQKPGRIPLLCKWDFFLQWAHFIHFVLRLGVCLCLWWLSLRDREREMLSTKKLDIKNQHTQHGDKTQVALWIGIETPQLELLSIAQFFPPLPLALEPRPRNVMTSMQNTALNNVQKQPLSQQARELGTWTVSQC